MGRCGESYPAEEGRQLTEGNRDTRDEEHRDTCEKERRDTSKEERTSNQEEEQVTPWSGMLRSRSTAMTWWFAAEGSQQTERRDSSFLDHSGQLRATTCGAARGVGRQLES
jgi:hypothetical protein